MGRPKRKGLPSNHPFSYIYIYTYIYIYVKKISTLYIILHDSYYIHDIIKFCKNPPALFPPAVPTQGIMAIHSRRLLPPVSSCRPRSCTFSSCSRLPERWRMWNGLPGRVHGYVVSRMGPPFINHEVSSIWRGNNPILRGRKGSP